VPSRLEFDLDMAVPETRVTVLPNGLRVATEANPAAATSTVGVFFDAGSRYENDTTVGTAHFLEHMAFKGTAKRSMAQIEREIEDMGAHLNAFTSREHTCSSARCLKENLSQCTDVLADILQNSTYSEAAIERERSVILREMEEVEKQAEEMVHDHLHATAYQHSPLANPILGSSDNVKSVTKADLESYVKAHYTAPRTVVAAAGAVDHDKFVEDVARQFEGMPTGGLSADELVTAKPTTWTGSEVRMRDDYSSDNQLRLAVAFEGASWTDPDSVALMLIREMIGSYSASTGKGVHATSELSQRVAANGMASSFNTFSTCYKDTGLFGIYAECDDAWNHAGDLSWNISHALTKNVYTVEESDLERAKNALKVSTLAAANDGAVATALDIGTSMLAYGRRIPLAEMFARIDAVDVAGLKRVAERFFLDKDPAIVAWGSTQNVPDYTLFQRRTFWLRY
jgi:processing peptidase subunit beta